MTSTITVTLAKLRLPLAGVKGVELLVDGDALGELEFGGSTRLEVAPGQHTLEAVLRGVVRRRSRPLKLELGEGQAAVVTAKCSRLWGSVRLSLS